MRVVCLVVALVMLMLAAFGEGALGVNITMLSPCSSSSGETTAEVRLFTPEELVAMGTLHTSDQLVADESNLLSLTNGFGQFNVLGSHNAFIQTISGDSSVVGDSSLVACSILGAGTGVPPPRPRSISFADFVSENACADRGAIWGRQQPYKCAGG
jgi:hypothetical protein